MVDVLKPYTKEIADIKRDLPSILRKILTDNEDKVMDILRNFQLAKGKNSKGEIIGRYSAQTALYATIDPEPITDKVPGAPYNFQWTGGLFDGMKLFFEDTKSYSLFSADEKAIFLEKQYGDIFTLTKQHNERVNQEILRPEMYDEIIKRLFI